MATHAGEKNGTGSIATAKKLSDEPRSSTIELIDQLRRLNSEEHDDLEHYNNKLAQVCQHLRAVLADNGSVGRDVFRRSHGFETTQACFERLLDLTSTNIDSSLESLLNVSLVLMETLREHHGNIRYFSGRLDGWKTLETHYEELLDAVIDAKDKADVRSATEKLLKPVMMLALAEEFQADVSNQDTIHHPRAATTLIRLSIRMSKSDFDIETAQKQLQTISLLTKDNTRNQVALWNTGVISDLLPFKLKTTTEASIDQTLCEIFDNISYLGLGELNDVATLFKNARSAGQAQTILLELIKSSKQPAFIQFDLSQHGFSSIEMPSLPRAFPPSTGYTFSAWLRFDSFDTSCHTTIFGAFDASQTCFILLYLEKDTHQLILQTSITSARPSIRFRATTFSTQKWYHLTIVHRKSGTSPRQSPASLFIDGEFAEQVKCSYPDSLIPNEKSSDTSRQQTQIQTFLGTPKDLAVRLGSKQVQSRWSIASAHLFRTPLTDEFVAVQHRLSPRYAGNFQDCLGPLLTYRASAELNRYNELLHPDRSEKSDIVQAIERRGGDVVPESSILFSFNPQLVKNTHHDISYDDLSVQSLSRYNKLTQRSAAFILNAAVSSTNDALNWPYGTAVLTGDPVVARPSPLDDASWCLAGTLPLLFKLLESAGTKQDFIRAAEIFFECVKDSWRISEAIEKSNGFGVLALIIREKLGIDTPATASHSTGRKTSVAIPSEDRDSCAMILLKMILNFVGHDSVSPEKSIIVNPMAYRVLLIDFDTWRRCEVKIVKVYYAQFADFVARNHHQSFNHKRLSRMRVIKKLIDAMKTEDVQADAAKPLMLALRSLLETNTTHTAYKDLAMFVAFGLQEERAVALRPMRSIASTVRLRQNAANWASRGRVSKPSSATSTPVQWLTKPQLSLHVLQLLVDILCTASSSAPIRRFVRAVPTRWMSHLLSESDERIFLLTSRLIAHALATLGSEFKHPFVDKNGGLMVLKLRCKAFWRQSELWYLCFAMLFGIGPDSKSSDSTFTSFSLVERLKIDKHVKVLHPDIMQVLTTMLEAGLREIVRTDEPAPNDARTVTVIIQFLGELYTRSPAFQEFATSPIYAQELLFVLFPVIVGSDRLSSVTELEAEKSLLSFQGEEVVMRPHSNSLTGRPPSVRSLNTGDKHSRTPSPGGRKIAGGPKRLSSFVLINAGNGESNLPTARFSPALSPQSKEPVKLNIGNSVVESLLEVVIGLFIDQICNKKDFNGIGLFQKVPSGFREHQAYFESYILVNTISQLWSHLQLNPKLLQETKVLINLGKFSQHLAEAVFEGWFIDGAQPVIDFTGKILEHLQQPGIADLKQVRLCSQTISSMRLVFLRVTLLRLSELDEAVNETEAVEFLQQMSYWQTILFSSENQETLFTRLICFLLYLKLTSTVDAVRGAAANLWRTVLVQKPTETATLLTYSAGSDQRHLSTGFMKLVQLDDKEFFAWIDENRAELDTIFIDTLARPWSEFVNDENRRNEETANSRLTRRREKLRQWHNEESQRDDFLHRYETSTSHWRSNVHAQERLKSQRAIQDHQEIINQIIAGLSKLDWQLEQPCGVDARTQGITWRLDATEGINRMRMRISQDRNSSKETFQSKRRVSERSTKRLSIDAKVPVMSQNIVSPLTPTPEIRVEDGTNGEHQRKRGESISNSQLLEGGFEMVDDPKEDEDGLVEDKNRKIMTSLHRGDMVQQLYNISRIIGLEACEGLLIIGQKCLYMQDHFFQRSDGEIVSVSQAPEDERDKYLQLISGKDVGSQQTKHSIGDQAIRNWTWSEVLSVSKRRFLLRDVALEIFFTDGRSYLLTCLSIKARDDLFGAITNRAPHVHSTAQSANADSWRLDNLRNPEEAPSSIGSRFANVFSGAINLAATKKWLKGEMSNFQYLMLINTMAGRTFNDLTQYPVFPWVLADYHSEELDLTDPRTFRDFSKPMGCQTPAREAEFQDRYKQFAEMSDQSAPAFNYGTHYSSAMIVTSYLIRLQPFVQSYLLLQGGNFDHADRLFDSIEKAWLSSSRDNMTDVRELTPEFFYLPEFLTNINRYEFGLKQGDGGAVDNIILPPWAKGDPQLFIAKHREALESPYVSSQLHQWIDLVFGYKQRGEAAIAATNVFQHLSYGGAKDLDTIDDHVERLATIGIIHSFGQTPHQVFQRAHPGRGLEKLTPDRLDTQVETLVKLPMPLFESEEKVIELSFPAAQERLICSGPGKIDMLPTCDRYMQWMLTDNSIRFFSANSKRLVGLYENVHLGPITKAVFADSKTLITAGTDCTIAVWNISMDRDWVEMQSRAYLFGHRSPISILSASKVFSTLLSISSDGHALLWDMNRHECIRVLMRAGQSRIHAAKISNVNGHIAVCCGADIYLYTLNGHLLLQQRLGDDANHDITCCAFYDGCRNEWLEEELIFTGHSHGVVNAWTLTTLSDGSWHLQLVKRLNHVDSGREDGGNNAAAITAILPLSHAVFTGDELGRVWEWDILQKHGITNGRIR